MSSAPFLGIVSDTHGLVRPEALEALSGAEAIVHAGDVGDASVLPRFEELAPVFAVSGNVDAGWPHGLPERTSFEWRGLEVHVLHDRNQLGAVAPEWDVVVAGHSHRPLDEVRDGVLHLNPGSAGPRRFTLPIAVARLFVEEGRPRAELVTLDVG